MFSPEGYRSIKEVENTAKSLSIPGFESSDFHELLSELTGVFAASSSGTTMRLLLGVLAVANDGEYAFLDRKVWTIDLRRIREAGRKFDSLVVGQHLLTIEDEETQDPLLKSLPREFAESLLPFEGQALVINTEDADRIRARLEEIAANPPPRKLVPEVVFENFDDGVSLYNAQIEKWLTSRDRPNASEREKWLIARDEINVGNKRDRAREIRKAANEPDSWSSAGRNLKRRDC